MSKHEWRQQLEDGDVRLMTAERRSGRWSLRSRLKSEDEWTTGELDRDDLEDLVEVLQRKYRLGRVPYEHLREVEALLEAAGPPPE